jgi:hypothetical protein
METIVQIQGKMWTNKTIAKNLRSQNLKEKKVTPNE